MPSSVEYSTLSEPRRPRQTLRRRFQTEALEVARALCERQAVEWDAIRAGQYQAALVFVDALRERDAASLRRLLEVD